MRHLAPLLLTALLFAVSCGGGSGGDDQPDITFVAMPIASLDGSVDFTGSVDTNGTTTAPGGIVVGDSPGGIEVRGFFVFDILPLPPGARVQSATLEIRQFGKTGTPYFDLGHIVIDHVVVGSGLDATDFHQAPLDDDFAVVSTNDMAGTKVIDVTSQIGADGIAMRPHSAFRIQFTLGPDGNGDLDLANFQDADDSEGSGLLPVLTIAYEE